MYGGLKLITPGEMTAGPGQAVVVPEFRESANPARSVTLMMAAGKCRAHVFTPGGAGPWPGVLFLMDGFGMRPNIMEMAQRLADAGYAVLLPDLFYRRGEYAPLDVPAIFASGNLRQGVRSVLGNSPSVPEIAADAQEFLACLAQQPEVGGHQRGVVGYCMSGGMALAIAGIYPDRIAAAACFHGGLLVADSPDSPHRLAVTAKGEIYVGGAETDEWCPPAMVEQLDLHLADAGIERRCEIYQGTLHGWTMRDSPLHNGAAAEMHWHQLLALFERTLG